MSKKTPPKSVRLLSEDEAARVLLGGGAKHATARTLRWLMQMDGAPARQDYQIDLAAVAEFLRRITGKKAPGLKGAAALFDEVVPKGARPRALTYAERQARSRAKSHHNDIEADIIEALQGVNWQKRRKADKSLPYFLKEYCTSPDPTDGAFLEIQPPREMIPIAEDMQQAISNASIPYHIREARGHGKTSYAKGGSLWTGSKGTRRYIVVVGSNDENAENIVTNIFTNITQNPKFIRDYPEISIPFLKLGGAYQRAKTQTCGGVPTNLQKSANRIVFPTIIDPRTGKPFPSSGVVIEAVGFNAGARGKSKGILRPDLILFDDLQNDDKAQSEMQVSKMVRKIKKTFMGLAGHRKKIAAIMTSTPIEADDLSETFAADPGWKTKTYKMMPSYPKCHDLNASPEERKGIRDYWEEYNDIFTAEKNAGRVPHIEANKFYRKHRKEMDEGAKVLNPHNFDRETEISGIQHAMNILFRDGIETFLSEYQMEPPRMTTAVPISARLIMQRVRPGVPPRTIPNGTVFTAAATDINPGYAITTAVTAFDLSLTALVTTYHVTPVKIPDKLNDTEFNRQVYEALVRHGKELSAEGIHIDKWGVDANGRQFTAVQKFAPLSESLTGLEAVPMLGRSATQFNPNVRSRIRTARNDTVLCQDAQHNRWLAWNADLFKERMHRAWGTETGAPGGISLFDGNVNHSKFATQVANERLISKTKTKDGYSYKWKTMEPHDYGDCLAMCYALAASEGITGDETKRRSQTRVIVGGMPEPQTSERADVEQPQPKTHVMIGHA